MHFPALPVRQGHGMNSGQWTLAEVMDVKSQSKQKGYESSLAAFDLEATC